MRKVIEREYRRLGLEPLEGDQWVVDRRDLRLHGPYRPGDGVLQARNLNDFVAGTMGTDAPFFVLDAQGRSIPRD